jgi:hypothetical protein
MSGIEQITTTPTYGPRRATRLELMGIRFMTDNEGGDGGGANNSGYKAPESQEELDRIITARLQRQESSLTERYKDFDTLKSKAEQFDALQGKQSQGGGAGSGQDDQVSQRLADFEQRVTAAEKTATETQTELETARVELLRSQVALDKGIGKDDLILLTATTREDLDKQADRIAKLNSGSGKIPGQGSGGGTGGSTVAAGREMFDSKHKKTTS